MACRWLLVREAQAESRLKKRLMFFDLWAFLAGYIHRS